MTRAPRRPAHRRNHNSAHSKYDGRKLIGSWQMELKGALLHKYRRCTSDSAPPVMKLRTSFQEAIQCPGSGRIFTSSGRLRLLHCVYDAFEEKYYIGA